MAERRSPGEPGTYALVAGGGTAGHVLPGLAVARALVARGHDAAAIHFVGSERGLEASLVPAAGFGLTVLPGRGIQRRLTLQNVAAVLGPAAGRCSRASAWSGAGARRSCSCSAATPASPAWSVRCSGGCRSWWPSRTPGAGAANRLAGRFAKACGRAVRRDRPAPQGGHRQPGAGRGAGHRPRPPTGLRPARRSASRSTARSSPWSPGRSGPAGQPGRAGRGAGVGRPRRPGHPPRHRPPRLRRHDAPTRPSCPTVACSTSRCATRTAWTCCSPRPTCSWAAPAARPSPSSPRSGCPAVLVPLPIAPRDHQTANAAALVRPGAAILVPDAELDGDRVVAGAAAPARRARAPRRHGRRRPLPRPARRRRPGGRPRGGERPCPLTRPPTPARRRLGEPRVVHVVGIGGAGHVAPSPPCSPPWATGCPGATCATRSCSIGSRARWASRPRSATTPPTSPPTSTSSPSPPPCPTTTPRSSRPARRGRAGGAPRRPCWPPSPPTRKALAVAGTHGKTTTSSMLALVLAEAGLRALVHRRWRRQRARPRARPGPTGEWFVVEADESDGTFLDARTPGADRHQRRARPPRALRHGREPRTPRSRASSPPPPGRGRVCRRRGRRPARSRGRCPHLRHGRRRRPTAWSRSEAGRDGIGFDLYARRRAPGRGPRAAPRPAQRPQRRAALRPWASRSACPSRRRSPASARFGGVARRFEHRGEAAGVTFVDDYAHLPTEVAAAVAAGRDGGWRRVVARLPAAPLQPHRGAVARLRRRLRGLPTCSCSPTSTPPDEAPRPGCHRQAARRRGARRPRRQPAGLPAVARRRRRLPAPTGSAPATSCLTLGAGDLTTVPDRVLDRLPRRARARGREPARRRRRARSPTRSVPLAEPDAPLGAAHHLPRRWAGGRAGAGGVAEQLRGPGPGRGCRRLGVGAGPGRGPGLQPAGRRPGLRRGGRRARRGLRRHRHRRHHGPRRGRGLACRWSPGARAAARAHRLRVGGRGARLDRWCGAHERRRATAPTWPRRLRRVRVVDLRSGEDGWCPWAPSSSATAAPSLAPAPGGGERRAGASPPATACAAEAEIAEIVRWRREHQPGGANAGSVFTNPPGDSAGRLHRRRRGQGPAASARAEVSDQARQLHPGRRGRLGRRRRRP